MEEAVSERCSAFAATIRSDKNRQAYISASRYASSVITKAKAKTWEATCSSLSPKSVYSYPRCVAGSSSSFPNCSSPRESALVFVNNLRTRFSISQVKAMRRRTRGYLSEPPALRSLIRLFGPPYPPLNFLRLPLASPRPLSLAQTRLSIPC